MRLVLPTLVFVLTAHSFARADVDVEPPSPDAQVAPDASSPSSGGGGCSATLGTTEGTLVFIVFGIIGLVSFVSRRRVTR